MIGLSLLLIAQVMPTMPAILSMRPRAAGELLLEGRKHGPIVRIARSTREEMLPPSTEQYELFEAAVRRPGGCVRKKWQVSLQRESPDQIRPATKIGGAYPSTEVALRHGPNCDGAAFVHLNGDSMDIPAAIAALQFFDDVRRSRKKVRFSCTDSTGSGLCANQANILRELRKERLRVVMRQDGETIFWLGGTGQRSTELRYVDPRSGQVIVDRRIPPPF